MVLRDSFGPGDVQTVAVLPRAAYTVDEITDLGISSQFEKTSVRHLGSRLPVGWATGAGTIAGSLITAQMQRPALWTLRQYSAGVRLGREMLDDPSMPRSLQDRAVRARFRDLASATLPQQLPPFHLVFVYANESGDLAISRLYDVTITNWGKTSGVGEAYMEESMQYKALYYEQLTLQRSLSYSQLADMAGQMTGFASSVSDVVGLSEAMVNAGAGEKIGLAENLDQTILEDTQRAVQRARAGGGSVGIASEGDVVFTGSPGAYEEPARPVRPPQDGLGLEQEEMIPITGSSPEANEEALRESRYEWTERVLVQGDEVEIVTAQAWRLGDTVWVGTAQDPPDPRSGKGLSSKVRGASATFAGPSYYEALGVAAAKAPAGHVSYYPEGPSREIEIDDAGVAPEDVDSDGNLSWTVGGEEVFVDPGDGSGHFGPRPISGYEVEGADLVIGSTETGRFQLVKPRVDPQNMTEVAADA